MILGGFRNTCYSNVGNIRFFGVILKQTKTANNFTKSSKISKPDFFFQKYLDSRIDKQTPIGPNSIFTIIHITIRNLSHFFHEIKLQHLSVVSFFICDFKEKKFFYHKFS